MSLQVLLPWVLVPFNSDVEEEEVIHISVDIVKHYMFHIINCKNITYYYM